MADLEFTLTTPADVALTAATAKTVLQVLAPTNQRVKLQEIGVYFLGVSATATQVLVELVRQSTAGSGGTAATPRKWDDSLAESILSTGLYNITTEPTTGDILDLWLIHPQDGMEKICPFKGEYKCGGADRLGLRITAPANVSCRAKMKCEE